MNVSSADRPIQVFSMLHRSFGDSTSAEIFSEEATVGAWLRVEAQLALAQAELGMIDPRSAEEIAAACEIERIDLPALWEGMANVGYPILPLVLQIAGQLTPAAGGSMHFGATTQDIMDTGLALQLDRFFDHLDTQLARLGDGLATIAEQHATTIMAARTHGQQAVPTTFGAKVGVFLGQIQRQRAELWAIRPLACTVSLHGAAGSSAGFATRGGSLRAAMAQRLGLSLDNHPIHTARDSLASFGSVCARLSAICARLAREVIDLSRTEIAEVAEAGGHHRGASSTMPQKVNPVLSEAAIGLGVTATTLSGALLRAIEAGHERSAGEWQIEWHVIPQLCVTTAGAVAAMIAVVEDLVVDPERMAANIESEQGRTLAEAYMFQLASELGRQVAHDLVYEASVLSRTEKVSLHEALLRVSGRDEATLPQLSPADHLGEAPDIARQAAVNWHKTQPPQSDLESARRSTR